MFICLLNDDRCRLVVLDRHRTDDVIIDAETRLDITTEEGGGLEIETNVAGTQRDRGYTGYIYVCV